MLPQSDLFIAYNMRETYHELGTYEFKIVLNPKHFKNSLDVSLMIVDPDGNDIRHEVKRWGRKMTCEFVIDEKVADGVSVVRISSMPPSPRFDGRLSFWVIKP